MPKESFSNLPEIEKAYREWDRTATIYNFKVACILGIILMPAGVILDYFVYRDELSRFFELRLIASALIFVFLGVLLTRFVTDLGDGLDDLRNKRGGFLLLCGTEPGPAGRRLRDALDVSGKPDCRFPCHRHVRRRVFR